MMEIVSFFMWHHRRFKKSLFNATSAFIYLIFVTCHHIFWFLIGCNKFIIAIHLNNFWTVYVIYLYPHFSANCCAFSNDRDDMA